MDEDGDVVGSSPSHGIAAPGRTVADRLRRARQATSDNIRRGGQLVNEGAERVGSSRVGKAAAPVAELARDAARKVGQADAWENTDRSVELLVNVVRVQHAMVLDLLERVERLEAARSAGEADRDT